MEIQITRLDLNKTRANWPSDMPFAPAHIEKQPTVHPDDWFVLSAPLQDATPPVWSFAKSDPYVRVPLFQYTLSGKADIALASMVQIGLVCAGHLPGRVKKIRIVTGVPVDLLFEEGINTAAGMQYWFGLALTTEQGAT